jgi:hypothetical protein
MFLIDQSASMTEQMANSALSKAEALRDAINNLLYEVVLRCIKDPDEGPRHYYDIGVIGYGADVGPAFGGTLAGLELASISDVANQPLRVEERVRKVDDGAGGILEQRVKFPVWFEAVANNGTPMSTAIDRAGSLLASWVREHPDSFPPIVINISDGAATDGDPREWADRLRSLSTDDGDVLLFNLSLSSSPGPAVSFPTTASDLNDRYAHTLFDMSSVLPPFMAQLAETHGYALQDGARGFVFNADIVSVVTFLQIGTATHQLLG